MKKQLFDESWSQATKKHIKTSLVLYIRTMQKQLAPMGYHYKAESIKGKQHLEHVIPQNKIITALDKKYRTLLLVFQSVSVFAKDNLFNINISQTVLVACILQPIDISQKHIKV